MGTLADRIKTFIDAHTTSLGNVGSISCVEKNAPCIHMVQSELQASEPVFIQTATRTINTIWYTDTNNVRTLSKTAVIGKTAYDAVLGIFGKTKTEVLYFVQYPEPVLYSDVTQLYTVGFIVPEEYMKFHSVSAQ
jgi:hypothetical protein